MWRLKKLLQGLRGRAVPRREEKLPPNRKRRSVRHNKVKKVYSASVTPLTDDGQIDTKSLRRLIDFDIQRGIHEFFFLGTTGEWFALSSLMKSDLIAAAPTEPIAFAHAVADEADKPIYLYHLPGANIPVDGLWRSKSDPE